MKKSGLAFLALMMISMLTLAPAAWAKKQTWPLAILWPPSNFSTQGTMEFAKLVKERTGGQLNIEVHAGGALGFKGPEMLKVIRDGMAPIGEMLLGYVAGTEPLMDFSTMPFLVANAAQAEKLGAIARPAVEKVFDKWNQKMLYWQFWPGAGIYSQKPIKSLADLKGLKIRTFNAVSTNWVKAAGGNPVSLPWGDVYMAMSTGAIDALITSSTSGADGKFWEVMKYFTRLNFTFGYSAVTVNKKSLARLSAKENGSPFRHGQGDGQDPAAKKPGFRPQGFGQTHQKRDQDLRDEPRIPKGLRRALPAHLVRMGQKVRAGRS